MCIFCHFRHNAGRESDNGKFFDKLLYGITTSLCLAIIIVNITPPEISLPLFLTITMGRLIWNIFFHASFMHWLGYDWLK
mgnify:FL=1